MVAETKVKGRSQSSRKEKVGEERKWGEKKKAGWGEKAGRKRGGKKGGKDYNTQYAIQTTSGQHSKAVKNFRDISPESSLISMFKLL